MATKALNWVREERRRYINLMWLATNGKFILTMHPDMTFRYRHVKPEYTDEGEAELLAAGMGQGDVRPRSIELDGVEDDHND